MDALAGEMDQVLGRLQRAGMRNCTPRLNPGALLRNTCPTPALPGRNWPTKSRPGRPSPTTSCYRPGKKEGFAEPRNRQAVEQAAIAGAGPSGGGKDAHHTQRADRGVRGRRPGLGERRSTTRADSFPPGDRGDGDAGRPAQGAGGFRPRAGARGQGGVRRHPDQPLPQPDGVDALGAGARQRPAQPRPARFRTTRASASACGCSAKGAWGFAASPEVTKKDIAAAVKEAVAIAHAHAPLRRQPVQLAPVKAQTGRLPHGRGQGPVRGAAAGASWSCCARSTRT